MESSWDQEDPFQHYSLMPIVSEFAKQRKIETYHKVFTDAKSFKHWIETYNNLCKGGSLLYIAAHGYKASLCGLNCRINKQTITNAIAKARNIQFVHFGSCLFGNEENLKSILKKATNLSWIAGYDKSVDWVDSSLFDIFLWSRITPHGRGSSDKNLKTHTIVKNIIELQVAGMVKELGFKFVYRYGKNIESVHQ